MTAGVYDDKELQRLKDFNTDVCFVCLSGNDIRPYSNTKELVNRLLVVTDQMKNSGVKKIYVSEISTRGDFSKVPGLTKEIFDIKRNVSCMNRKIERKKSIQGPFCYI